MSTRDRQEEPGFFAVTRSPWVWGLFGLAAALLVLALVTDNRLLYIPVVVLVLAASAVKTRTRS